MVVAFENPREVILLVNVSLLQDTIDDGEFLLVMVVLYCDQTFDGLHGWLLNFYRLRLTLLLLFLHYYRGRIGYLDLLRGRLGKALNFSFLFLLRHRRLTLLSRFCPLRCHICCRWHLT